MDVKTYRAKTLQEALALVRRDLGPDAAVLHTRDVRAPGLLHWILGTRRIEVQASTQVAVPSRLPARLQTPEPALATSIAAAPVPSAAEVYDFKQRFRDHLSDHDADLQSMVEDLCRRTRRSPSHELPEALFRLFTDLIEADVSEDLARELIDRVRREAPGEEFTDMMLVKARIARMIEDEIRVSGPIRSNPGRRHVVALVGPTGVGKTTTIAKLAANFRLKEKRRVGLITVDTYRIAAVEQLRTYADIIDLPMEVVSTPREMRTAVARLSDLDLILMDTAGRSPRDEVKIQELRSILSEAGANEVHLVLSSMGSAANLARTAEQFNEVGATSLILTKLDETAGLGNLLPLIRSSKLPLSYLTDGQNVPDDIRAADRAELARMVLGMETAGKR